MIKTNNELNIDLTECLRLVCVNSAEKVNSYLEEEGLDFDSLSQAQERACLTIFQETAFNEGLIHLYAKLPRNLSVSFGLAYDGEVMANVYEAPLTKFTVKDFILGNHCVGHVFASFSTTLSHSDFMPKLDGRSIYLYSENYLGDEFAQVFNGMSSEVLLSDRT